MNFRTIYDKGTSPLEQIVCQLLRNGDVFWLKKKKKERKKEKQLWMSLFKGA